MQSQEATNTTCAIVCSSNIALRENNNFATICNWRGAIQFTPKPLHRRNRLGKNSYQDISKIYTKDDVYIHQHHCKLKAISAKLKRTTADSDGGCVYI